MPSSNDESSLLSLDARCVATIRCVLAIALAFILTLDPLTRARFSEVSDLLLGLYATYSVVLYLAVRWWRPILLGVLEPWIDVGWARGPMALSSDPSWILFRFSFFALLINESTGVLIEIPLKESRHADSYGAADPDLNHRRPSDRGRLLALSPREQAGAEAGRGTP